MKITNAVIIAVGLVALAALVLASLYSYQEYLVTMEGKIVRSIRHDCRSNPKCQVQISSLSTFDWDKMYIFSQGFNADQVEEVSGLRPSKDDFAATKFMFVKDNAIVFYEQKGVDWEGGTKTRLYFKHSDSQSYGIYTPDTAVFSVETISSANGGYYNLTPVQD